MIIPQAVKEMMAGDQVVLVATTDKKGTPHMAAAKGLTVLGDERVAFENWFCFRTLGNIHENPEIALSLLKGERGFQLIGVVERSLATEVLDGYSPEVDRQSKFPQTKYRLLIRVNRVIELSTGPHSDE
ncbi:MAG: pyridoxamine 5'-phosphate oxidase family protein [Candidatus Lindowbacteria bacterium]|nr:pyridoxamine 5'-phosphate oxidase family protein [Candidatus Lindowbacteria bacterium]